MSDHTLSSLPLFTSPLRLQEFARGAPEGEKIHPFALPPRVFFQVTKDMPPEIMVNPGSIYGKSITKYEAATLLDGTYLAVGDRSHKVKLGDMLLRQPNPPPEALLAMLAEHFKSVETVEAAYVMEWENSEEMLPHMLIALDAPLLRDIPEAMPNLEEYTRKMVVDFSPVSPFRSRRRLELAAPL